jgi:hypothetical protein
MKKIHIEFSDERLITPSGLVFVGQYLEKAVLLKKSTVLQFQKIICRNR